MQQGISNPEFYGDLVYKLRKSLVIQTFLISLDVSVNGFKRTEYNLNIYGRLHA